MKKLTKHELSINVGDRVAEWGSYVVGTVILETGECCLVQYDRPVTSYGGKRKDRIRHHFKKRIEKVDYYQEFWNAVHLREQGIETPMYAWLGD